METMAKSLLSTKKLKSPTNRNAQIDIGVDTHALHLTPRIIWVLIISIRHSVAINISRLTYLAAWEKRGMRCLPWKQPRLRPDFANMALLFRCWRTNLEGVRIRSPAKTYKIPAPSLIACRNRFYAFRPVLQSFIIFGSDRFLFGYFLDIFPPLHLRSIIKKSDGGRKLT